MSRKLQIMGTFPSGGNGGAGGNGIPDLNQNDPNGEGYVKNRTHWKEETMVPLNIQWDGVTDNRVSATTYDGHTFYKVSDVILTDEELRKCTAHYANLVFNMGELPESSLLILGSNTCSTYGIAIIRNTAESIVPEGLGNPVYVEETGLYFVHNGENNYVSRLCSDEITIAETVYHPLDIKYLPIVPLTQTEYDALVDSGTVHDSTLYMIVG
jgi:hypothetical protein